MAENGWTPPDQAARLAVVREKRRNVVVDAGAGAGKTRTLVDRVVELVAPGDGGPAPRLAAVAGLTFTRRAAGELRLRVRETLLRELGSETRTARRRRLESAIGELDRATFGTIHGFADRLLRMRPVEAGLSPSYRIAEDEAPLVAEVTERLWTGAASGTLPAELPGSPREEVQEAEETVRHYLRSGLRAETEEGEWVDRAGLDAWVAGIVGRRDVAIASAPPPAAGPPQDDREPERALGGRLVGLRGRSRGANWLRNAGRALLVAAEVPEPAPRLHALTRAVLPIPKLNKRDDFEGDEEAWAAWKSFQDGEEPEAPAALAPLRGWLGARLVRAVPVVLALYERVKERHEVVDQTDLLVKLRDLLRGNLAARRDFQALFAHILVDEFQDTDPLQAEILCFLAEQGARARAWREVRLAPGRITIVGDPKQAIYRFRRADVATYAEVRGMLCRQGALAARLEVNFRSRPALLRFYDAGLSGLLGPRQAGGGGGPGGGDPFDPATGQAFYEPMVPGPAPDVGAAVHVLPYAGAGGAALLAGPGREVEAETAARYLRWLRDGSGLRVRDPEAPGGGADEAGSDRPIRWGDVAILADKTTSLRVLFRALERFGVPYAARGATLFAGSPVVRAAILGLRAVSDPDDGVAQATLLRPPFLALDLADAVAGGERLADARAIVADLRKGRGSRLPSATLRRLVEGTAFGRVIALGPNGAERLAAVRELGAVADRLAHEEGLDLDGVTERLRGWIEEPEEYDAPAPLAGRAVHVTTIHQAKGLEFPVVLLWDGFADEAVRSRAEAWTVEREGREWAIRLDRFEAASEGAAAVLEAEKALSGHERRRLYYVACTRARDLLVLPRPRKARRGGMIERILGPVLDGPRGPSGLVRVLDEYRPDSPPPWAATGAPVPAFPHLLPDPAGDAAAAEAGPGWAAAVRSASAPRSTAVGVTVLERAAAGAPAPPDEEQSADLVGEADERRREGRHGPEFGSAVHRALEASLRGAPADLPALVAAAADLEGLADRRGEAVEDVRRALGEIERLGLRAPGVRLLPEYPLSVRDEEGRLVIGYVDLVAIAPGATWVVDWKTDAPLAGEAAEAFPHYAAQVRRYAAMLREAAGIRGPIRAGLLFTATGEWREVPPG
ncbi:MAG: UvrD-helicase domain-containing protein [Planctomycetales bacterium]|nr:UvrD-helicase domain-containing protein [Planctomycetales bacterium]